MELSAACVSAGSRGTGARRANGPMAPESETRSTGWKRSWLVAAQGAAPPQTTVLVELASGSADTVSRVSAVEPGTPSQRRCAPSSGEVETTARQVAPASVE
jgi:hypothetical protein